MSGLGVVVVAAVVVVVVVRARQVKRRRTNAEVIAEPALLSHTDHHPRPPTHSPTHRAPPSATLCLPLRVGSRRLVHHEASC